MVNTRISANTRVLTEVMTPDDVSCCRPRIYWFTRSSMSVPLSSFTFLLSEETADRSVPSPAVESFLSFIPTTPWVFAVIA
jgi:hypothetical protein